MFSVMHLVLVIRLVWFLGNGSSECQSQTPACPIENRPTVCHLVHLVFFSTLDLYVFNTPATICVCCTSLTASIPSRGNTAVWENLANWDIEESMTCNMIRRMHMVVIFTSTTGTSRHTGCSDSTCCNMPFRLKNKKNLTDITVLTVLAVVPVNAPVSFVVLLFLHHSSHTNTAKSEINTTTLVNCG